MMLPFLWLLRPKNFNSNFYHFHKIRQRSTGILRLLHQSFMGHNDVGLQLHGSFSWFSDQLFVFGSNIQNNIAGNRNIAYSAELSGFLIYLVVVTGGLRQGLRLFLIYIHQNYFLMNISGLKQWYDDFLSICFKILDIEL